MQQQSEIINTGVVIVGAGPIGIELAIVLHRQNVDYHLIEAKQVGHAFTTWPPNTHFYSTPEHVALAGIPVHNLNQQPISGEQYLAYLRMLVEQFDLNLHVYEPVASITKTGDGFQVQTQRRNGPQYYHCRYVVLATGGMARPRLLNIPGEDLPHVTHYFPGPHLYFRTRVLIVGGKNSAIEAALRCWRGGAQVALSYRRSELNFDRIKPHLAMDIGDRLRKGEIEFLPATLPLEITPTHVMLAATEDGLTAVGTTANGRLTAHETDFVLLCTGFEADMSLFAQAGVPLEGEAQVPKYDPETLETAVSGLFVAGTAAGGTQSRFVHFISTTHDHVARIARTITGNHPGKLGTVAARNNAVTWEEVKAN